MSAGRGRLWRRVVPPLALLMVLGSAGAVVAQAAEPEHIVLDPLTAAWSPADAGAVAGEAGEVTEAELLGAVQQVEAPVPSASPAPIGPQIEVVLPPPPPPPAAGRSGSGRSGSGGGGGGGSYPLLDSVNAARAAVGAQPLSWSSSVASGAKGYANTMCAAQDALMAGGATAEDAWASVFKHAAFDGTFSGENIYTAYGGNMSYTAAHNGWMNSPGHYANIVRPQFTKLGLGACTSASGVYFAVERFDY